MGKQVANVMILAGLLVCAIPAQARFIEDWPYDKLFKHADLVVFATAMKTEAADDKPPAHSWSYEFAAQTTTFKVSHALKGKADGEPIKVLHYKFGELKQGVDRHALTLIIDGPSLVAFRTSAVTIKAKGDKGITTLPTPEYLLFLKRMPDGRFEPVSGQIDPALSVREVSEASDKVLGESR